MEIAYFATLSQQSFFIFWFRVHAKKRSLSSSHSSHSILTQPSVASDAGDEVEGSVSTHHAKVAERRSNGSSDFQGRQLPLSHASREMSFLFVLCVLILCDIVQDTVYFAADTFRY